MGMVREHTTLVSYIGAGEGKNNLDAVKRWLDAEYENLTTEFGPISARQISLIFALHLSRNAPLHIAGE